METFHRRDQRHLWQGDRYTRLQNKGHSLFVMRNPTNCWISFLSVRSDLRCPQQHVEIFSWLCSYQCFLLCSLSSSMLSIPLGSRFGVLFSEVRTRAALVRWWAASASLC